MIETTSPNGTYVVQFGAETISFALEMRQRRRLSISVHPDRRVTVLAPAGCSLADVLAGVQQRAAWITRQRAYFEQFHPLPHEKRYVGGETHLYLGRQYRLKIHSAVAESVKLTGGYLHVTTADRHDVQQVKRLLDDWYRHHARGVFHTYLLRCLDAAPSLRLPPPAIIIRRMSRRWGSCTKAGNIVLNLDLVKTSLSCIEYVIMHELCHLRIHNHSPGVLQSPIALPARLGKTQDAPGFIRHIGYAAEPQQDQGRHLYFSFPDTIRAEYSWLSPLGERGL